jgi:acetylornithine deacetylase/succinyl-diaminopimelate desuccinylase-like protein
MSDDGSGTGADFARLDAWVDANFDEEVRFLQALVRVPTDTPPGDNAPHAEATARLLEGFGFAVERHPVPDTLVREHGLTSIVNLVVRRGYGGDGPTIALNAHGDVVPPGEGWLHDPYGGEIDDGKIYGRAAAVSKSDFATYSFAVRALESLGAPLAGGVELHLTYDEEFGGELGPGWLLREGIVKPDLLIAAGFSYQVVTAHNGCLQLEVTVHGRMAHAAIPASGVDALQGATVILSALYAQNEIYRAVTSKVAGITHPYLNVGTIAGGTNTNVVPGKVVLRLDRRMIPEEDPAVVEATLRQVIAAAAAGRPGIAVEVRRLLLARALGRGPATRRSSRRCGAMARRCSACRSRNRERRSTPTCASTAKRRAGGDLRRRAAHRPRIERQARRRASRARRPAGCDQGRRANAARVARTAHRELIATAPRPCYATALRRCA